MTKMRIWNTCCVTLEWDCLQVTFVLASQISQVFDLGNLNLGNKWQLYKDFLEDIYRYYLNNGGTRRRQKEFIYSRSIPRKLVGLQLFCRFKSV